eukprot:2573837-Amphidinium_carterae.2
MMHHCSPTSLCVSSNFARFLLRVGLCSQLWTKSRSKILEHCDRVQELVCSVPGPPQLLFNLDASPIPVCSHRRKA